MVNDITLAVHIAMKSAIEFCIEKTKLEDKEQVLEARHRGDCSSCEYLRYGLAKELAEYLASVENRTQAIYIYDELETPTTWDEHLLDRPNLSPGIRMIVWVKRKSPALSTLVDSLSSAADEEFRQLPCPNANALCYKLDVTVVDDHEVQERIGYGALITSAYLRPIEIWRK